MKTLNSSNYSWNKKYSFHSLFKSSFKSSCFFPKTTESYKTNIVSHFFFDISRLWKKKKMYNSLILGIIFHVFDLCRLSKCRSNPGIIFLKTITLILLYEFPIIFMNWLEKYHCITSRSWAQEAPLGEKSVILQSKDLPVKQITMTYWKTTLVHKHDTKIGFMSEISLILWRFTHEVAQHNQSYCFF